MPTHRTDRSIGRDRCTYKVQGWCVEDDIPERSNWGPFSQPRYTLRTNRYHCHLSTLETCYLFDIVKDPPQMEDLTGDPSIADVETELWEALFGTTEQLNDLGPSYVLSTLRTATGSTTGDPNSNGPTQDLIQFRYTMLSMEDTIQGVCPIVDTPFTDEGNVDYESLENLINVLTSNGCHALAMFGVASEFYKLTDYERKRMTELLIEKCEDSNASSVVSITPYATRTAVAEAERAESLGADALMVFPPAFRDPDVSKIANHLATIGESVSIPVMIQYAPGITDIDIGPEVLVDLYEEVATITHFKIECDPPGKYITRLLDLTDGEANVLVGNAGYHMIESYDRGATGVMPASSMYEIYLEIHNAYHGNKRDHALDVHTDLLAMLNQLTKVGIQYEKELLSRRGIIRSSYCRQPETSPDKYYDEVFDEYYEKYIEPKISTPPEEQIS